MKQKRKIVTIVAYSILLLIISGANIKMRFITIPISTEMISRQIDYITISTVFAGFSFTALGLLLGLSSEELIERIKNTNIIMDKIERIISSIVYFILSVAVSLFFVLGLNDSLIGNADILSIVDNVLYILSVGYLIGGIAYFIYSVYELYDLVKRVYEYNRKATDQKIDIAEAELEATKKKMRDEKGDNQNKYTI